MSRWPSGMGRFDNPGHLVFKPAASCQTRLPAPLADQAGGVRIEPEGRPPRVAVTIKPAKPG